MWYSHPPPDMCIDRLHIDRLEWDSLWALWDEIKSIQKIRVGPNSTNIDVEILSDQNSNKGVAFHRSATAGWCFQVYFIALMVTTIDSPQSCHLSNEGGCAIVAQFYTHCLLHLQPVDLSRKPDRVGKSFWGFQKQNFELPSNPGSDRINFLQFSLLYNLMS